MVNVNNSLKYFLKIFKILLQYTNNFISLKVAYKRGNETLLDNIIFHKFEIAMLNKSIIIHTNVVYYTTLCVTH